MPNSNSDKNNLNNQIVSVEGNEITFPPEILPELMSAGESDLISELPEEILESSKDKQILSQLIVANSIGAEFHRLLIPVKIYMMLNDYSTNLTYAFKNHASFLLDYVKLRPSDILNNCRYGNADILYDEKRKWPADTSFYFISTIFGDYTMDLSSLRRPPLWKVRGWPYLYYDYLNVVEQEMDGDVIDEFLGCPVKMCYTDESGNMMYTDELGSVRDAFPAVTLQFEPLDCLSTLNPYTAWLESNYIDLYILNSEKYYKNFGKVKSYIDYCNEVLSDYNIRYENIKKIRDGLFYTSIDPDNYAYVKNSAYFTIGLMMRNDMMNFFLGESFFKDFFEAKNILTGLVQEYGGNRFRMLTETDLGTIKFLMDTFNKFASFQIIESALNVVCAKAFNVLTKAQEYRKMYDSVIKYYCENFITYNIFYGVPTAYNDLSGLEQINYYERTIQSYTYRLPPSFIMSYDKVNTPYSYQFPHVPIEFELDNWKRLIRDSSRYFSQMTPYYRYSYIDYRSYLALDKICDYFGAPTDFDWYVDNINEKISILEPYTDRIAKVLIEILNYYRTFFHDEVSFYHFIGGYYAIPTENIKKEEYIETE